MTVSLEQKELDNQSLGYGAVNRCVGSLQLYPVSFEQIIACGVSFIVAFFIWATGHAEIAFLTFFVLSGSLILLGGQDFGREVEKMKATRSFYSESPPLGEGPDGLPIALFTEDPTITTEKGKKYHSLEQQFDTLRFYGSYEVKRSDIGFYYLNQGTGPLVYIVYGFKVQGFSPCMDHMDCMTAIRSINRAFKNLPDLKLKFIWDIPGDASAQILQQKKLLDMAEQDGLTVEIANQRGKWATRNEREGAIVAPSLRVYARVKAAVGQENFVPQDWKDKWAAKAAPLVEKLFGDQSPQALIIQSMDFAFDACCTPVMRAFTSEIGLRIRPFTVHELYSRDFAQLHDSPVEKCPQYIRRTDEGLFIHQDMEDTPERPQPTVSHHILGELFKPEGNPSVPVFYRKDIWLPNKGIAGKFAACIRILQMEGYTEIDGSHGIGHLQNTFRWMAGISDIQFITEIEAIDPIAKKNLMDKGIKNRTKRSNRAIQNQTQDVDSMEDIEDLLEARRLFRAGEQTLSTATLIWVYADDREKLQLKQEEVMTRIGKANCELVQNSIEYRWIDSQPYAWEAMCRQPVLRRPEYMMTQAIPLIPWTQPQALDSQGLGYIGKTISAQYFIDYCGKKNHTFMGAKSGGGKSMQGLDILAQCIATRTPTVFLDSPPLADQSTGEVAPSTYTPAIEVWKSEGVNCAYQDMKKQPFNVLGRYGLGQNKWEIETLVETHIDTLLALVIGDNPKHPLRDYLTNFLSLSYQDFMQQVGSTEQDPILEDYLRHYIGWSNRYLSGDIDLYSLAGLDHLGEFEPSEQERQAIGMIRSQLLGVLSQPWGKRINAQTAFDTNVMYLVLGLTNVRAGSKEGLVYALAALAFMDRITSKYPRSIFGMDEGSTLLPMHAFASKFARIFPEGRKKGANGILIATELNSLWDSPYCGQILDNFDNILVGYSEETSVRKFVDRLGFKEEILRKYTKAPDKTAMSSDWYLKRGDQHLELLYHTLPILLGIGATSPEELEVSRAFRSPYPHAKGLGAYTDFGRSLYSAYAQGRPPESILV